MHRTLLVLTVVALALPPAILVLWALGQLLGAMGDAAGMRVLGRIALGGGVLWALDLIFLVLAQGLSSLGPPRGEGE